MKIKYSEDLSLRSYNVNLCTRSIAFGLAVDLKHHTSSIAFGLAAGPSARQRPAHFEHSSLSSCEAVLLREKRCFTIPATRSIASRLAVDLKHHTSSIAFGLAAGPSGARQRPASGFTLLEVMVALAIFAVAAIALTKVAMQYTQSTSNAILRTKAQFVGMNEVAMMEINQEWLEGTQSKQVTSQGETWQIDKKAQSTISPKIQRIELQVSLFNNEQGKVEAGITNLVFFNYPAKARTQ
ncbi:type II secretion system protein I [Acinetobacter dispersus]|uniref:Type II secretion system protein I n=1 Tax=Acinetobacter dispersus TaxID=70348 RepID=N9L6H9_9GAMM|nr:type II secretion system protein I [Acinetobacter dispersus]